MARLRGGSKLPPGDYEVGYCKPPKETRWKKGYCPNRKGRPTKAHTIAAILDRLLDGKVTVRDETGQRQVTRLEYLLARATDKAGKGDLHALKFLIEMRQRFPTLGPDTGEPKAIDADDLAIIEDYMARLQGEEGP